MSEDDRPRANEPEDDEPGEDEEPEQESSTPLGTLYMPHGLHPAEMAETFTGVARNVEEARQAAEREREREQQDREEERRLRKALLHAAEREAEPDRHGDVRGPGEIPTSLVEEAVLKHVREGLGRRTLARDLPGLTEWTAGQILRWYKVGKPVGLWLDEQDRLRWGAAITAISPAEQGWEQRDKTVSPTPAALRLPRL